MHAVAETEDGRLFAAESYVKASGGCSAPSSKDAKLAATRMGQMRLKLEGEAPLAEGQTATAQLLVSHPNNNGMQVDQLSHNFIPARYIQEMRIQYNDLLVMTVETDISLSEDPAITFGFRPDGPGTLRVKVQDSTGGVFRHEFPLPAGRS